MDLFKVRTGTARIMKITQKNYINATGKTKPYKQENAKGGDSYFAVCPECENPIQIIGLFKNTSEAGRKPYGKHFSKTIPGLASYSHPDYVDCSYSNPKWAKKRLKRQAGSKVAQEMLTLLRNQFDRVIYILEKDTEMHISYQTAKQMLRGYLANEGWYYRTATLNNLPWTFGETESALTLYGRKILFGSDLCKAIQKNCPEVSLLEQEKYVKVMTAPGQRIELHYLLLDHKKEVRDEHLTESIDFWVFRGNAPNIETIYRKTISIETDYFMNLIQPKRDTMNRNQKLLNLANETIE